MQRNDTVTCAITPGAACVTPSTASVFRPVVKADLVMTDHTVTGCTCSNGCAACGCCTPVCGCAPSCGCVIDTIPSTPACGCTAETNCATNSCCTSTTCSCAAETNTCATNTACTPACGCAVETNNCASTTGCTADTTPSATNTTTCVTTCTTTCTTDAPADDLTPAVLPLTGKTPAMVYEAPHTLAKLYNAGEAIRRGTLFAQLDMPMMGECAAAGGAPLCAGQAEAFAAWELRLYLNTHPADKQALQLFKQYARKAYQPNYASAYAFDAAAGDRWSWTDAPWPWETGCSCQ